MNLADVQQPENSAGSQAQANSGSTSIGSLNVGGSVAIGNNISIINHYYPIIEKNTEQHEPDYWALKHPYPMPPNFTGRIAERAMLTQWLNDDSENRLFILRALAASIFQSRFGRGEGGDCTKHRFFSTGA